MVLAAGFVLFRTFTTYFVRLLDNVFRTPRLGLFKLLRMVLWGGCHTLYLNKRCVTIWLWCCNRCMQGVATLLWLKAACLTAALSATGGLEEDGQALELHGLLLRRVWAVYWAATPRLSSAMDKNVATAAAAYTTPLANLLACLPY
jgi:hypothetical protein